VLDGNDTLALLPTGGGKSVCFQVPSMMKEGICLVVSPLIALMKDQVENLRQKGIRALAVVSGMSRYEVDVAFDNAIFGNYKFLYLSPERLISAYTKARIEKMKVNLIAVDEAHCISQWGYDFRPPYLEIAEIRSLHPDVPVIALTATATPEVVSDIQKRLLFKKENVLQKSFERKNLSYIVLNNEDKIAKLLDILHKVNGSTIVYVRSRKAAKDVAVTLRQNEISAEFYHAGLQTDERNKRQLSWLHNEVRVMVATNAFGMGIDKPDVRIVIHLDMPDSLEAYFQEAGRAGRDEKQAYAVLFFNEDEIKMAEQRFRLSFPPVYTIRKVYHALGNFLQIPDGSGLGVSYDFDINEFSSHYQFDTLLAYNSLKILEMDGYLSLSEAISLPSSLMFTVNSMELYKFQIQNPALDYFIKTILRSYSGVFDEFVKINEKELAVRAAIDLSAVIKNLEFLSRSGVMEYRKQTDKPQLTFLAERIASKDLQVSRDSLQIRKERFQVRQSAVIRYASTFHRCRQIMLLNYFGEKMETRCGSCDYCRSRNKLQLSEAEFETISERIKAIVMIKPVVLSEMVKQLNLPNEDKTLSVIQWMLDNDHLSYNPENKSEIRWVE